MISVEQYAAGFSEEEGYLDFAAFGPPGRTVLDEHRAMYELLRTARFGSFDTLRQQGARLRDAVGKLIGFRSDQVVFQANTSTGLIQAMFGLTGGLMLSPAEFPSVTFAAVRAAESLQVLKPIWLQADYRRVTPSSIREALTPECQAVAVSLVDSRTGYLADLDGIRQVIGDRLLIVDAVQGFGVVDAPYAAADVVVSGGQKWVRAGWGTGFLAMSDRAAERLTPVLSGFSATDTPLPLDEVPPPTRGAAAFSMSPPNAVAEAVFATALEELAQVGVEPINRAIIEVTGSIIDLADEFAIPIASSRVEGERAGIVVLAPPADRLTVLVASLFNHGVTATARDGTVRLAGHVSTTVDSLGLLRDSFISYATAITV